MHLERLGRAGRLSPAELVSASLEAIDARDGSIEAWVRLNPRAGEDAASLTKQLEAQGPLSPLHGMPVGIKDIFDTAGLRTEWGTPTLRRRMPGRDSALVAMLKDAGCVVIGKTVTTAFAYFDTGPTRNPCHPAHTPGGSSSGSAAAVAAGMVPLAVGSQTQGSVLRPASFCGIAGFKPGHGLLPLEGVMPFAPTLDHAGIFAATAGDLRVAWLGLGFDSRGHAEKRATVIEWPPSGSLQPAMATAFEDAISTLATAGVAVRRVPRPSFFDRLPEALLTVMASEAAREHGAHYRKFGSRVGEKMASLLDQGLRIPRSRYRDALATIATCRADYASWSSEHPIVATPAAPGPAPRTLLSSGDPCCNAPFTALGAPAVSIPMPVGCGQLPLGLQLAVGTGQEAGLLATAEEWQCLLAAGP